MFVWCTLNKFTKDIKKKHKEEKKGGLKKKSSKFQINERNLDSTVHGSTP